MLCLKKLPGASEEWRRKCKLLCLVWELRGSSEERKGKWKPLRGYGFLGLGVPRGGGGVEKNTEDTKGSGFRDWDA